MEENSIPDSPEALYRKEVFEADNETLIHMLQEVSDTVIPDPSGGFSDILLDGMNMFSINDTEDLHYENFQKNYYRSLHKVVVLHHKFAEQGLLLESEGEECVKNLICFNKMFEIFHYWEQAIRSLWYVKKASHPLYDSSLNTDIGLFRFKPIDPDANNCFQNLILYLLTNLAKRGWRRQDDQCMERIYTPDGYDTHAWKPVMDIRTFVYSVTQMDVNYQHWYNLTQNAGNAQSSIKYLTNVCDLHFIDVQKDRKLFSFANGIYETAIWDEVDKVYKDRWYPHQKTHQESETGYISYDICPKRSACKHFEENFDNFAEHEDWYDIPTPHFQSILDYQKFPPEVSRWMYILLCGRLLFEVGDLDEWQVMPFLRGKAKSGKSTILTRVCKQFFHALDVGVISNNIEAKFGLSAIHDKLLFIAPEIGENFKLDQCDFQTMISGEDTSVAEKYQTAKSDSWKVPGAMAGNKSPGYTDNQGSLSRRLIVFLFSIKVKKGDTQLGKKLSGEIPALIKKGTLAYLEAIAKHGKSDIWNVLPRYFKDTQDDLTEQTNPLVSFIKSGKVELGDKDSFYCKQKDFIDMYNDHIRENNLKKSAWKKDFYESIFEENGIDVSTKKPKKEIGKASGSCKWYLGIKIVSNSDSDDDGLGA